MRESAASSLAVSLAVCDHIFWLSVKTQFGLSVGVYIATFLAVGLPVGNNLFWLSVTAFLAVGGSVCEHLSDYRSSCL